MPTPGRYHQVSEEDHVDIASALPAPQHSILLWNDLYRQESWSDAPIKTALPLRGLRAPECTAKHLTAGENRYERKQLRTENPRYV